MFWRRMGPEEARVRLLLLREGVRQKVGALGARLAKRKAPLEKALKEYRGCWSTSGAWRRRAATPRPSSAPPWPGRSSASGTPKGRSPGPEEAHRQAVAQLVSRARLKAARLAALAQMEEALDRFFPTPETKEEAHA